MPHLADISLHNVKEVVGLHTYIYIYVFLTSEGHFWSKVFLCLFMHLLEV